MLQTAMRTFLTCKTTRMLSSIVLMSWRLQNSVTSNLEVCFLKLMLAKSCMLKKLQ
ncbi:hypothetical protein Hdeb2414_s0006g00190601 [Helianthus debilis subsp. tardiflorus]